MTKQRFGASTVTFLGDVLILQMNGGSKHQSVFNPDFIADFNCFQLVSTCNKKCQKSVDPSQKKKNRSYEDDNPLEHMICTAVDASNVYSQLDAQMQ
eukprot:744367_1